MLSVIRYWLSESQVEHERFLLKTRRDAELSRSIPSFSNLWADRCISVFQTLENSSLSLSVFFNRSTSTLPCADFGRGKFIPVDLAAAMSAGPGFLFSRGLFGQERSEDLVEPADELSDALERNLCIG